MGFYMLDNPNPNTPQGVFPRRGTRGFLTGTCILHTTESILDRIGDDSTAEDCAAFIGRRTDYGCYHTMVDSDSIIEMYPYEWETWQDSETNNWAVGISMAIRAAEWLSVEPTQRDRIYRNAAKAAADFVIYMREVKGIDVPLKRISGAAARAGEPGFCAHGDSGINRSDPGVDFDYELFFKYTQQELNGEVNDVGTVEGFTNDAMRNLKVMVADAVKAETANILKSVAFQEKFVVGSLTKLLDNSGTVVELSDEDITTLANSLKANFAPEVANELAKRLAE